MAFKVPRFTGNRLADFLILGVVIVTAAQMLRSSQIVSDLGVLPNADE